MAFLSDLLSFEQTGEEDYEKNIAECITLLQGEHSPLREEHSSDAELYVHGRLAALLSFQRSGKQEITAEYEQYILITNCIRHQDHQTISVTSSAATRQMPLSNSASSSSSSQISSTKAVIEEAEDIPYNLTIRYQKRLFTFNISKENSIYDHVKQVADKGKGGLSQQLLDHSYKEILAYCAFQTMPISLQLMGKCEPNQARSLSIR